MTNPSTAVAPATARRAPQASSGHAATPAQHDAQCILVLQGGGALGAYQAGVFEAMARSWGEPDWVAGISIGAINAALIAGNPVHRRVERLHAFWDLVSSACTVPPASTLALMVPQADAREILNEASAAQVLLFGVPGFFVPRFPPPACQPAGTAAALSWYDTTPLRSTLERLVDFDRINAGATRLSVGAVNVRTGNFAYFDSAHQRIDARHIMASGALPPGFAPVEIDGEQFWDGGLVSNTPLHYVLDQPCERARMVFQVDLFPAAGAVPTTLADAVEREKDIRFSSRTRMNTTNELDMQVLGQAAARLVAKLPPHLRNDPDVQALASLGRAGAVEVVHLIYRSKRYETQSKDYEFSRLSMQEHWEAGRTDMDRTLGDPRWLRQRSDMTGVHVFDLDASTPPAAPAPA